MVTGVEEESHEKSIWSISERTSDEGRAEPPRVPFEERADPGNYSRVERGLFRPPQDRTIVEKYATALGLEPGSDEWLQLFDLAAAERGQVPEDIMSDEELVDKLPVLFRTMRATQVSPEKLDEFIEKIRRS